MSAAVERFVATILGLKRKITIGDNVLAIIVLSESSLAYVRQVG